MSLAEAHIMGFMGFEYVLSLSCHLIGTLGKVFVRNRRTIGNY